MYDINMIREAEEK